MNRANWIFDRIFNVILYFTVIVISPTCGVDYVGYKVYNVNPINIWQNQMLQQIIRQDGYDFWVHPRHNASKIMVAPHLQDEFERFMNESEIATNIFIANLGEYLNKKKESQSQETRRFNTKQRSSNNNTDRVFDFSYFPRFQDIKLYLRHMAKKSKHARIIKIGRSMEGRPIVGLEIKTSSKNPTVFLDAGMHAREWAAPVTALYIIKKLLENETHYAQNITFVIIPSANPDGYEYSHLVDRLWRKNRATIKDSPCKGVDLNRNFDAYWNVVGTDLNPCTGIYAGSSPFSEPESRAIRDAIIILRPTMYLTFHSFGGMILYPWGYTTDRPSNWKDMDAVARITSQFIKSVNEQEYTIGSAAYILYPASGGSDDWAYDVCDVPIVYTFELPDFGGGFEMPVEKIKPVGEETFEGFRFLLRFMLCGMSLKSCQ